MMNKNIYVIISQPNTKIGKLLHFFSRQAYNHVSISLTPTLEEMYSFGRRTIRNPFNGGFVKEGIDFGVFKQFDETKAIVLELNVSQEAYDSVKLFIENMLKEKDRFNYNYRGLFLAWFRKDYEPKYKMYCSQFVRKCLEEFNIGNVKFLPKCVRPMDFLNLKYDRVVYKDSFKNFKYSLS